MHAMIEARSRKTVVRTMGYLGKVHIRALILATIVLCLVGPASATTWNAAADFSATNNPTGQWSYGWSTTLTSTLNLYTEKPTAGGLEFWNTGQPDYVPGVWKNPTASEIDWSTLRVPAGGLVFHPGPNNEYSHVMWTPLAAGTYTVNATFTGIDTSFGGTDVHIYVNGGTKYAGEVAKGYGQHVSTSFTVFVPTNGKIDFAVGYGSDGSYGSDSTGLMATISSVPLPSTLLLLGSGIVGLLVLRRREKGFA